MRPRRNCADLGINDQGSTPSYARNAILPVGMAALHGVGVEARLPRGPCESEISFFARDGLREGVRHGANHDDTFGHSSSRALLPCGSSR